MSPEDKKNMQIANCRICTLCQNHCADCPLNWALKLIEPFEIFEIPLKIEFPIIYLSTIEE
jgi:hypothetical protein